MPSTSTPRKLATILIVDDHPMIREGLAMRIASQPDLKICGEADRVDDALALAKATHPDLMIIDLSLKEGHGVDLIKMVRAWNDEIKMLVSSMYDESLYAERVIRAGAMGYINKQEMPERVLDAIRQVLSGKIYLSPRMAERLVHRAIRARGQTETSAIGSLSDRELEIFQFIGRGITTRQIAHQLKLSIKTVDTHRANIKTKLDAKNGAELSRMAVQWILENG